MKCESWVTLLSFRGGSHGGFCFSCYFLILFVLGADSLNHAACSRCSYHFFSPASYRDMQGLVFLFKRKLVHVSAKIPQEKGGERGGVFGPSTAKQAFHFQGTLTLT